MKNSSKKNFPGKNNKDHKKNSDYGYYSKNTNRSEKNDRFLNNSAKNRKVENLKKIDENNTTALNDLGYLNLILGNVDEGRKLLNEFMKTTWDASSKRFP